MGKFVKGHPCHTSPETIEKLRQYAFSQRGVKRTDEDKKKISAGQIGKKVSEETKEKLRKAHTGKKHSQETIDKRRESRKNYRHSPETIKKMKETKAKIFEGHIYKTDESKIARQKSEYRDWRELVYTRDDWTCQKCLVRGGLLHPHHIKSFKNFPALRYETSNGITLCVHHHTEFHKKFGYKNSDEEQLNIFLKSIECDY